MGATQEPQRGVRRRRSRLLCRVGPRPRPGSGWIDRFHAMVVAFETVSMPFIPEPPFLGKFKLIKGRCMDGLGFSCYVIAFCISVPRAAARSREHDQNCGRANFSRALKVFEFSQIGSSCARPRLPADRSFSSQAARTRADTSGLGRSGAARGGGILPEWKTGSLQE